MHVFENISNHSQHLLLGLRRTQRVRPGDGVVVEDDVYQRNLYTYRQRYVKHHHLVTRPPYGWLDWRLVEYLRLGKPVVVGRKKRVWGFVPERELMAYLQEKIPNTTPGALHIGHTETLVLIADVSTGMWREVVRPGVTYLASQQHAFIIYAYRPGTKKKHLDLKLYFHWINNHGVARVKWHDTRNERKLSSATRRHIMSRKWGE